VGLVALRLTVLAAVILVAALWEGCVPLTQEDPSNAGIPGHQEDLSDPGPTGSENPDDGDSAEEHTGGDEGQDEGHEGTDNTDSDSTDNDEPGGEGHEDETGPSLSANEGEWVVIESELTTDECGLSDSVDRGQPGATMDLFHTGSNTFDLTFHEGGELVHCSLMSDEDYDCEASYSTDDTPASLGLNAQILVEIDSDGDFLTNDTLVLQSAVELECQGPNCGLVQLLLGSSFPCTMVMVSQMESANR